MAFERSVGRLKGAVMMWIVDPVSQVELWVPAYATPGRAISREARRRGGALRTLWLVPELGSEWPISDPESLEIASVIAELSSELQEALQSWNTTWLTGFHYFFGWPSAQAGEAWLNQGPRLTRRLQEETWDFADVEPKYETYSRSRAPEE